MRFSLIIAFLICSGGSVLAQRPPMDPSLTVGVESCRDCHEEMAETWEKSAHAKSFETMASSDAATEIAKILKLKQSLIPETASCIRCHYTQEMLPTIPQPTAGISCESCHGAGWDWIDEHNRKSLSRSQRIESATEKGMVHPGNLYAMVKSCYGCHVVDDEQLVNHAGHPAISDDFEILSWYSGEVKHNFLVKKDGKAVKSHVSEMQEIPRARRRMIYLAGKLHHLAHTLEAMSRATDAPVDQQGKFIRLSNGRYTFLVQHALELKRIQGDLEKVLERVAIRQYAQALTLVKTLDLTTGHQKDMQDAGDEILRLTEDFCKQYDGTTFAAIDPILDGLKPKFSEE